MRFLSKLLKRWYLYIIPLILFPAVAAVFGQNKLSTYETSALLYIHSPADAASTDINTDGFNQYATPAQNGTNVMTELLQSESFMVSVAKDTDLAKLYDLNTRRGQDDATAQLQREITIAPTTVGINNLTITVDDKNSVVAQQIASALLTEFTGNFAHRQLTMDKQTEAFLVQQLTAANAQLNQDSSKLSEYLAAHPNELTGDRTTDPQLTQLQQQYTQDSNIQQNINQRINAVRFDEAAASTGTSSFFTVLDQPLVPLSPTLHAKKLVPYIGGGAAAALALIGLIVGLQTFLDKKVYSSRDIRAIADELEIEMPAIHIVPVLQGSGQSGAAQQEVSPFSGVLVPALTGLPHATDGQLPQELRRTVGMTAEDDA